jgi:hypothetical protein
MIKTLFLLLVLAAPASASLDVPAIVAEFDRVAAQPFWPNFEPAKTPLMLFDGQRTWLVRHPSPPEGFQREGGLWVYSGRHPEARSNTSVDLGGVLTATVMLDLSRGTARSWAAVAVHEAFHVFQRQRHPTWAANEADLFLYPVDDPGPLGLRRLESEAFRRALAAKDSGQAACWANQALERRRERFALLPAGSVTYERASEMNEGLPTFMQNLAAGEKPGLPAGEFDAEDVRERFYAVGPAMAALLDRLAPGWRDEMEKGQASSLDEVLAKSLAGKPAAACGFTPEETAAARERAKADAARVAQEKKEVREKLLGRPGWKVEIAAGSPLWPQGFDPLNIRVVTKGEVVHSRWLKLGNERGTLEVLDRDSLTEAAGEHPLFNGVRRLTVTGFPAEPSVRQDGESLVVEAQGFTATLKGAKVEKGEGVLKLTLP